MKTLITGASSGLGAEMARQFAALGHDLVLTARRRDRLEQLRQDLLAAFPQRDVRIEELDVLDDDAVAHAFHQHAPLDRVIVNAGVGSEKPIGVGDRKRNRAIAMTNFVAALAQIEAAMEVFRAQERGHLVVISSFSAVRGLRGGPAVYAATKRGVAHLAEGLRAEMLFAKRAIDVTTVYPGYIRSELTADLAQEPPFTVDTQTGVRAIVAGIESRRASVYAPKLPWVIMGFLFRILPLRVVAKLTTPIRGE